jgi:hypothetical protein
MMVVSPSMKGNLSHPLFVYGNVSILMRDMPSIDAGSSNVGDSDPNTHKYHRGYASSGFDLIP